MEKKVSYMDVNKARLLIIKLIGLLDESLNTSTIDLITACELSCNLTKLLVELERVMVSET